MVGAELDPPYADDFWAYLPPGKERDPGAAQEAAKKAERIVVSGRNFELQRDKILKIIYDSPGMMIGGRLLFVTVGRKVQLRISRSFRLESWESCRL